MPVCSFVREFRLDTADHSVTATILSEGGSLISFGAVVQQAFPEAIVFPVPPKGALDRQETFDVVSSDPEIEARLDTFLRLLERCITIDDSLDECHALSPHSLPSDDGWNRTRVGNLVHRAKDYYSNSSYRDRDATDEICGRVLDFFSRHPRYGAADTVVPAPSSNPEVQENLPWVIASFVCEVLDNQLVIPRRLKLIPAQKGYDEIASGISREELQEGTVEVDEILSGAVVVIDDLYGSGGTLTEVARACRSSSAASVLGLAITKIAKQTKGMDIALWPWG